MEVRKMEFKKVMKDIFDYRNCVQVIHCSPFHNEDCTTGDSFTMDSVIVSAELTDTDDIYYMEDDNKEYFKECVRYCQIEGEIIFKDVENTIVDVIPFADVDCINIASRKGMIEE